MSQQINLFNPIFLKQKKHFSALTMAQGLALVLVGSLVVAGYARFQLSGMMDEARDTASQLNLTKAQLAKVSAAYAPRQPSKALEEDIRKLEADIIAQQRAFDTIRKGGLGNTKGYSEYLRAFARQIVNGLWLTGFTIRGAGAELELRGRTAQPALIPAYINRLKQEPAMQGKSFAALVVEAPEAEQNKAVQATDATTNAVKVKQRAPYLEFVLKSDAAGGESADAAHAAPPPGAAPTPSALERVK